MPGGGDEDHKMSDVGGADSGDSGSDDDDSSSSSDEEVEVGEQDMSRLMQLEAALEANPNQYDTHLEVCNQ
jgi:hypothetical protein